MSQQVRITSIDALEAFRAELIQYLEKARTALDDVTSDVRQTQVWLEVDRRQHWEGLLKKRRKQLDQAEQELYSASLSSLKESNVAHKLAVTKARRLLQEAEDKLRVIKSWRQAYDNRAGLLLRQLDAMYFRVSQQMPKGVFFLSEAIKTLQAYAESHAAPRTAASAAPAEASGPPAAADISITSASPELPPS